MTEAPTDFSGMTVNERLFAAGLLDQFLAAEKRGDEEELRHLAAKVGLRRDSDGMHWSAKKDNYADN